MRNVTLLGAAGAAALGLAFTAPAHAQTSSDEFSGPYVGGSFGYSMKGSSREGVEFDTNRDGTYNDVVRTDAGADAFSPGVCGGVALGATLDAGCDKDREGIEYHARAGYDLQFGNFVVGALAEFGRSEASDSVTAFSTTPANYVFTRELDWNLALRGRAGVTFNRTLVYGTGGATLGRLDRSFSSSNTANSFTLVEDDRDVWGWQVGGGVEQKLGSNFSVGVEYLYNRYNDEGTFVEVGPGSAPETNPFLLVDPAGTNMQRGNERFDFHSLRAVAAFRF